MEIKVLGMGCARCRDLEKRTRQAVAEAGLAVDIEKVEDIQKIMAYKILATPALVIDESVKASGRVPSIEEIKTWLKEAEKR